MNKLFFITGFPRSGTTWFSNLFNSHPDVIYRHEVIGRCYSLFSNTLFKELKYNHGLSEKHYQQVMQIIISAQPETDRPPFSKKNHLILKSPDIHQALWLLSKSMPLLKPAYSYLYKPKGKEKLIFIKETRSSKNMLSIIQGLRSQKNIFLFRHPCGCVSSILTGIKSGKMKESSINKRKDVFKSNQKSPYFSKNSITEKDFITFPEYEYRAILWRLQNDDYLTYNMEIDNCIYVNYELFLKNTLQKTKHLFKELALDFSKQTLDFIEHSSSNTSTKQSFFSQDSGSKFYSVYRGNDFNPDAWKEKLTKEQISTIEKHTLECYQKLLAL